MSDLFDARTGVYYDSVALMQVSARVKRTTGISDALIGMGTPLNLDLMRAAGFDVSGDVGPGDLVIAVRGDGEQALAAARTELEAAFDELARAARASEGPGGQDQPPLTVESAADRHGANLAVVSVAGEYAGIEALAALDAGCSVLLFSDNVDVATEVELKRIAGERDLLLMGPDCGTAMIGGVGLGFANTVPPGPFGIVAASGTGSQQVATLLAAAGTGVSHLLGTGGRDLGAEVGGASAAQAMRALAADARTERIIVVSKPADTAVVGRLEALAADLGVPVSWAVLGPDSPDLTAGVEAALEAAGHEAVEWPVWGKAAQCTPDGPLVGLFVGGTLADEAMLIASRSLGPIASNIPLPGAPQIGGSNLPAGRHAIVDFGDDSMTEGRAHPMIDPSLRLAAIREQGENAGVLLLDLVLGHGAHPSPGAELAAAISDARSAAAARGRELPVLVSLIGTTDDPQDLEATAAALVNAGAQVFASNSQAVRQALALVDGARAGAGTGSSADTQGWAQDPGPDRPAEHRMPDGASTGEEPLRGLLGSELIAVNCGVGLFAQSLRDQAIEVAEVSWQPPSADPAEIFAIMADPRRLTANALALERMLGAGAELIGLRPARECLGLRDHEFLHSGPPLRWENASGPMRGALAGAVVFEGLAESLAEAEAGLAAGTFTTAPCHSRDAVGPMAGVVSPSMWMFELRDPVSGNRAYCSLNEGLGKVLRYGANGPEVLDRLRWMRDVLGPVLARAVESHGPIDTKSYVSQMLQSGDEGHNRNRTATLLFLRDLMPDLLGLQWPAEQLAEVCRFLGANDYFALNLVMPTCKLAMAAAKDIPGSSLIVTMARNGTEFGVQTAGAGPTWFTGPAQVADGLYLGSYGPEDANPDIGDSAITETAGIGGLAMAAAPAVVRLVGGDVAFAVETTRRMYEITAGEHPVHQIPMLEFRGVPSGIDVVAVLRTGVLPQINTGMAGRVAGVGQVGAGLVTPPWECFTEAASELARATGERDRTAASAG
ncbi:DUF1116 domain-containing protein [Brevibacterium sp. 5221]|uniref:DUF1116 domain-containing protein n=1 Tax=Brevibacterium rongguiense TaxID=2695267 RepID=A0A6N9H3M6_9MICO|nr:DUF1116 domain-containing protein [Brevibacterium rongguiense]MYM18523.1 DUF1116 domain-containing protein [Brevibacterium rongguiense]